MTFDTATLTLGTPRTAAPTVAPAADLRPARPLFGGRCFGEACR